MALKLSTFIPIIKELVYHIISVPLKFRRVKY